jgi:hypothetical protein
LEQVKRGFAWAYTEYLDSSYISEFYSVEKEARNKEKGLWKQANPTPPWEWRKIKKYKEKVFTNEDLKNTMIVLLQLQSTYVVRNIIALKWNLVKKQCFIIQLCGLKRLDGDNDGVPCENLCGHH